MNSDIEKVKLNQELCLDTEACLLIFDPHQHVDWVKEILEKEKDSVTHLLLGGDYWDCWDEDIPPRKNEVEVALFLLELINEWREHLTLLWGNHDIAYYECCQRHRKHFQSFKNIYNCSGFSFRKAENIYNVLPDGFWRQGRLFQKINGFLISHAGVASSFWPYYYNKTKPLELLEGTCAMALNNLHIQHRILDAGNCRGGIQDLGGITWLDFDEEFRDQDIPLPQIVGHTIHQGKAVSKGRSWCLDGNCTCYGVLHQDGKLEVKYL